MDTYWHYVTLFLGFASKSGSKSGKAASIMQQCYSRFGRAGRPAHRSGKHNKKGSTMFRKLGIGLTALALMTPGGVAALGVGDYELNSYLNQPLDMQVRLHDTEDLDADEILVSLAGEDEFEKAGVSREFFLNKLDFEVRLNENGSGTLQVTTREPVREPYLNFLVEVLWPTGRILREYTVLLDPPSRVDQQAQQQARPAPAAQPEETPSSTVARPARTERPPEPVESRREPVERPAARAPEPADRETYEVRAQDTMWRIALNHRPDSSISVQQMLVATQRLNEGAFIDGNVNLVREGSVLRIPTQEEVRRINTREAMGDLSGQNRRWREMLRARGIDPDRAPLEGTPSVAGDQSRTGGAEGQVKLVSPESDAGADGTGTGSRAEGGADAERLQNELAIREETLDQLRRENEELGSRLDDLEEQVSTSEELLSLRNEKIARLQDELRQLRQSEGVDVSDDLLEPVEDPVTETAGTDEADEETAEGEQGATDVAEDDTAAGEQADVAGDGEEAAEGDELAGEDEQAPAGETAGQDQAVEADDVAEPAPEPATPESPVTRILDFVMGNLAMIAAGLLGLVAIVVAAVLMLRRRGGNEIEEGPLVEADEDDDFMPAGLLDDDEDEFGGFADDQDEQAPAPGDEGQDPLEEVDVYVAYGRYPQAVEYLRNEIGKAPERNDLKVRLLEVLAEMRDTEGFEKEAEALAGTDGEVDARIQALRQDMEGSAGGGDQEPSLDDLEMDLTSGLDEGGEGSSDQGDGDDTLTLDTDGEQAADEGEEDFDFGDFDLSTDDAGSEEGGEDKDDREEALEFDLGDASGDDDDTLTLDTGDQGGDETLELEGTDTDEGTTSEDSGDLEDLEFSLEDLDTGEDSGDEDFFELDEGDSGDTAAAPGAESEPGAEETDSDREAAMGTEPSLDLDDGFDLDIGDDDGEESGAADLDDMSLDFDDGSDDTGSDDLDLSLEELDEGGDDELTGLEDEQPTAAAETPEPAQPQAPEPAAPEPEEEPTAMREAVDTDTAADAGGEDEAMGADELLGDDEDFDFLGDSDENATKLDLAKAYIDMGDSEGARDILNEVLAEGSEDQQSEARNLLSQVG